MQRELSLLRQVLLAGVFTGLHAVVYMVGNHLPLGTPRLLPMTALDEAVPFLPATVFVYLSDYALAFVAFLSLQRRESVHRFLWVFMTCVAVAGVIHWVYPTAYPRERFPIPDDAHALSRLGLSVLRYFDSPNSCLPSLHVATATGSAVLVYRERPRRSRWLVAWALLVVASTLTAKQHYAVDLLAGWAMLGVVLFTVDALRDRRRDKVPATTCSGSSPTR
ncbi:MAG: inositol phosphorylceramide synthase [Myxococcales bacterium]|nr:inositol phosphorylceramide synthase [Myxococcales bacterium]